MSEGVITLLARCCGEGAPLQLLSWSVVVSLWVARLSLFPRTCPPFARFRLVDSRESVCFLFVWSTSCAPMSFGHLRDSSFPARAGLRLGLPGGYIGIFAFWWMSLG
jgi:hypothetical protein